MTKAEYIDFIRNSLPQVDKTSRFHPKQVEMAINLAINTVYWEMYKANPKSFAKSMERYTSLTSLTVSNSVAAFKTRYASAVTVDVVDLPRKTSGILGIELKTALSWISTTTTKFIPVSTMEGEQFYGSEASLPDNVIGFSYSGVQTSAPGTTYIEYWNMDAATATLGVYVRLIRQFKSYSATESVILPYGQDQNIIQLVREFLGATPPKDLVNNNADMNANG